MALKTCVYVDGFNLYYGCLRKTNSKWLDLSQLCQRLLPKNKIEKIRYFTAPIVPRGDDPQQRTRQEIYIRALRTIPNLTVHNGHFLVSKKWAMKADLSEKVKVIKTEEKGSDVNLASYILIDAFESKYDIAVIVSNDSDLVFPIEYVKKSLGKTIGILNPHEQKSRELFSLASFYKPIRKAVVSVCQFPDIMRDSQGEFFKPKPWSPDVNSANSTISPF